MLHHGGQNKSSSHSTQLANLCKIKSKSFPLFLSFQNDLLSILPCIDFFLWLFLFLVVEEINPNRLPELLSPLRTQLLAPNSCRVFSSTFDISRLSVKLDIFTIWQTPVESARISQAKKVAFYTIKNGVFKFYGIRLPRRKHRNGIERGAESTQ